MGDGRRKLSQRQDSRGARELGLQLPKLIFGASLIREIFQADQRHIETLGRCRIRDGDPYVEEAAVQRPHFHDFSVRSEEHTSELQSLMRISYAVFCFKKKSRRVN